MSHGFAPLPNKVTVLVDALSSVSRPPRRYESDYVRPPRRSRSARAGTTLALSLCFAAAGLWLMA